jgi:fused signal recognition particle receptor
MAFKWFKRRKDIAEDGATVESAPATETDEADSPSKAVEIPVADSPPAGEVTVARPTGDEEAVAKEPPAQTADFPLPDSPPATELPERENTAMPSQSDSEDADTTETASEDKPRRGLFKRLRSGLTKTRDFLNTDIEDLFSGKRKFDDEMLEELEERLIAADLGVRTSMDLIEKLTRRASKINSVDELKAILREEILALIEKTPPADATKNAAKPRVVMVVGVNGVGKTTTIGKLAAHHTREGRKVLIAAADTFRAAAIEQLTIWAERSGADIVKHKDQADPAAVAYDAVAAAIARDIDVVLIDTAGRLHTKVNLMAELKKIKRSVGKKIADAPHETLLILDATTGQNALAQAQMFDEAIDLDALALTKLDGTAKGGIVVSICSTLNIPLRHVGVGEQIDDLQAFNAKDFVEALF